MEIENFLSEGEKLLSEHENISLTNNRLIIYTESLFLTQYKDLQLDKISSITHKSAFNGELLSWGGIFLLGGLATFFINYVDLDFTIPLFLGIGLILASTLLLGYAVLNQKDLCVIKSSATSVKAEGDPVELMKLSKEINEVKNRSI